MDSCHEGSQPESKLRSREPRDRCIRKNTRDRQLRFQLDFGHDHTP
eukprot:gene1829-biopygen11128